jgi:hypothetical protein
MKRKHGFFHGDVFLMSVNHAKWIAKLGGKGYDYLTLCNRMFNCFKKNGDILFLSKKMLKKGTYLI